MVHLYWCTITGIRGKREYIGGYTKSPEIAETRIIS